MDTFRTIASKRDLRSYAPDPVADDLLERILEAGRLSGNAMNRQQRRLADRATIPELAGAGAGQQVEILLSFGYPPGRGDPGSRSLEEWLAAADREPLDDLVTRV